jgi:hypothetical protein
MNSANKANLQAICTVAGLHSFRPMAALKPGLATALLFMATVFVSSAANVTL